MSNQTTEKEPSKDITITDLNEDCIRQICSNLYAKDKINLMLASDRIVNILSPDIDLRVIIEDFNFDVPQIKEILSRAGPNVKTLQYNSCINKNPDSLFKIIFHAGKCWPNIQLLDLSFPYRARFYDYRCPQDLFVPFKQIQILELRNCVSDEHLKEISTLPDLKHLDLSFNDRINGKYLGNLKNIEHLHLTYCKNIESEHFIAFCSANKLKRLSILRCDLLNDSAIDALIETQTDLEKIAFDNYINAHVERICQLRNLKYLHYINDEFTNTCANLLTEAVRFHTDLVETIVFRCSRQWEDMRVLEEALKIKNLKKLITTSQAPESLFNRKCDQFDACWHDGEDCETDEPLDLLTCLFNAVLKLLENSQHLKIFGWPFMRETLLDEIVTIMKKRNSIPLKISCFNSSKFLKTEEYLRSKDFVLLTFSSEFKNPDLNTYFGRLIPLNEVSDYEYLTLEKYVPE